MLEASGLYHLECTPATDDKGVDLLVVATGALIDAGHVARQISQEIKDHLTSEVVARFDIDQLFDYRARRPPMTFERDKFTSVEAPELALRRVADAEGKHFLLLDGPEPDYQWERCIAALAELIDVFGVTLTVNVHGIPLGVPHTRLIGLTRHATSPRLIPDDNKPLFGEIQIPGSFTSLLEFRLGEADRNMIGFSVHVPHYLTQSDMPEAALVGMQAIMSATGLILPTTALSVAADVSRTAIDAEIASSPEVSDIVTALEEQYDQFVDGMGAPPIALSQEDLPTADEIGAEFERFLRTQDE